MNENGNFNYLTNSLAKAQSLLKETATRLSEGTARRPWGQYQSNLESIPQAIGQQVKNVQTAVEVKQSQGVFPKGRYSLLSDQPSPWETAAGLTSKGRQVPSVPTLAAAAAADVLTDKTRKEIWKYTNPHRVVGEVGQYTGPRLGLENKLSGALVAAAVPVAIGALSGQIGSPLEGFRPKGYKAVAPVSKEEDPSGRKTRSPLLEATMRYALGQKSQMLPYADFVQERPDVMPSTYVNYRRYSGLKPEAGKSVVYDPQSQSFSALGGAIRGTAHGLNDPELRIKNVPVTASAVLGTAAGLGAIRSLSKAIAYTPLGEIPESVKHLPVGEQIAATRQLNPPGLGEKIGNKLGQYADPALLAAGAVTAAAVGYTAKKLFQKAAERRVKKENPVEYLKYKHGSLEQAKSALGKPEAHSWQELAAVGS